MLEQFSKWIDRLSEYLAHRKGLIPMLGILLVAVNFVIQFIPSAGWIGASDLFLHLGLILAIIGIMVAWAL